MWRCRQVVCGIYADEENNNACNTLLLIKFPLCMSPLKDVPQKI
jgi:hypothetical protein